MHDRSSRRALLVADVSRGRSPGVGQKTGAVGTTRSLSSTKGTAAWEETFSVCRTVDNFFRGGASSPRQSCAKGATLDNTLCHIEGAKTVQLDVPSDSRARLIYVYGDATVPLGTGNRIIAHICNDTGAWGRGFVLFLSRRAPESETACRAWHRERGCNDLGLGAV